MLERMIVKRWIALTVGFTLLGVLIRVRYNTQGHFAIGGEWLAPAFMLFLEWLIRMMRGVLIDAGIIRGHKKRRRKARVQHDRKFTELVQYAERKAAVAGKDESYIPYLLPDVIKEYFIRNAINEVSTGMMEFERYIKTQKQEVTDDGRNVKTS